MRRGPRGLALLCVVAALVGCGSSGEPVRSPATTESRSGTVTSQPSAAATSAPSPPATTVPSSGPIAPLEERCPGALGSATAVTAPLTTEDGVQLYAATIGDGGFGLVMANDVPHSICEELPEAVLFAEHGYRVEVFDYRDRGESGPSGTNAGRLDLDVAAAAGELERQDASCVVLAGSYGGAAAAIVAAVRMDPKPAAVLAFDPAPRRGEYIEGPFDPEGALTAAPRLRMPVLYVTLRNDRFVPLPEVRRLVKATGSPDTTLVVVSSGIIGWGLLDLSPESPRVQREVFSFLRDRADCG